MLSSLSVSDTLLMPSSDDDSSKGSGADAPQPVQETPHETTEERIERYGKLFKDTDEFVNLTQQRIVLMPEVPLERAKAAKTICFRQNLVHRITPIPENIRGQVEELDLYDNKIKRIRNLEGLCSLKTLDLSFNNLRTIENLENLPALETLYLVQNKITHLGQGLAALAPSLTYLELGANRIRDLENALVPLTKLQSLWLGKNKFTTEGVSGPQLTSLVNLRVLSFQNNRMTHVPKDVFSHMPHLEELYLSENGISVMECIGSLPKLKILDVARNRISEIADIDQLPELEEFWANDNQISSWRNVASLAVCKKLTGVTMNRNPVETDQRYRARLKELIPTLEEIDTLPVGRTLPVPPMSGPSMGGRRVGDASKPADPSSAPSADVGEQAGSDVAAAGAAATSAGEGAESRAPEADEKVSEAGSSPVPGVTSPILPQE